MTTEARWSGTVGSVILLYFLSKAPRSLYMKIKCSHITTDVLLAVRNSIPTVKIILFFLEMFLDLIVNIERSYSRCQFVPQ
jgi:Trk-type K+ transport system membrane component